MFQGWILFFNAIFSGLIKAIVPIAVILAGPIAAIVTVWLEWRKDLKEKLQDRKDMWLDDHWKYLTIYLEDISEFGLQEYEPSEEPNVQILGTEEEYYQRNEGLGTSLCGYSIKKSGFEPYCKINLFKDYHVISLSHVESGYKKLNDLLESIFSDEKKYYEEMSESLNDIYLDIINCMNKEFPWLNIQSSSTGLNISSGEESYDVTTFLSKLIDTIKNGSSELSEDNINEGYYFVNVKSKEHGSISITSSKKPILDKFKKEIWSKLIKK